MRGRIDVAATKNDAKSGLERIDEGKHRRLRLGRVGKDDRLCRGSDEGLSALIDGQSRRDGEGAPRKGALEPTVDAEPRHPAHHAVAIDRVDHQRVEFVRGEGLALGELGVILDSHGEALPDQSV